MAAFNKGIVVVIYKEEIIVKKKKIMLERREKFWYIAGLNFHCLTGLINNGPLIVCVSATLSLKGKSPIINQNVLEKS